MYCDGIIYFKSWVNILSFNLLSNESCSKKARDDIEVISEDISIIRQFIKSLTSEANSCWAN